ncbi:MAG: hypothetical protein ACLR8P_09385 [Clostridium fessum]
MDFRSPDSVVEALKKAVDHGIFGYSRADESYFDAVAAWYQKRHHLTLQPEWMTCTPGIVFALSIAVRAFYPGGRCGVDPAAGLTIHSAGRSSAISGRWWRIRWF